MFEQVRENFLDRSITFVRDPSAAANTNDKPYRWVYWRQAPDIATEFEDSDLVVPESYHHTLVYQGVEALAKRHLYDEPVSSVEALKPFLKPFWVNSQPQYTRNGETSTRISRGQP
jgi:hypothetical protein